ncbi:hypothetical protein C8T65DRAFT_808032 [Cerioporus squamosus]|nr:hypothetical protein C8T65DRAFT_808032 [Cerioporus squamosus]
MLWTRSRALRLPRTSFLPYGCRPPRLVSPHSTRLVRGIVEQVAKTELPSFTARQVPVRNQILFAIGGTVGALAIGAHLTNYDLFKWWAYLREAEGGYAQSRPPTLEELERAKFSASLERFKGQMMTLLDTLDKLPVMMKAVLWQYGCVPILKPFFDATEGERMCWAICAVNCVVWLAWRVPRWGPFMLQSFAHNPMSGRSYTLFTSMLSHENFIHLAFNCIALTTFGAVASHHLVTQERGALFEATPKWHLLALFISAGLFSGLVNHIGYRCWSYPRLLARLRLAVSAARTTSTSGTKAITTSVAETAADASAKAAKIANEGQAGLGSSGAIYALFALTALGFPDAEASLIVAPWYSFNIQTGFVALVAIDVLGVVRGWTSFGHFVHLGGALFGVFWFKYGTEIWYSIRMWNLPAAVHFHGHGMKQSTLDEIQSRRQS